MPSPDPAPAARLDWVAPTPPGEVTGTAVLPGSKSLTNRYLVLASLASTPSLLRAPLRSRDTLLMAQALRSLGATVEDLPDPSCGSLDWHVTPAAVRGGTSIVRAQCVLGGSMPSVLHVSRVARSNLP